MEYTNKYTKEEAIEKAKEFLLELQALEKKHSISINTDDSIYLSYQTSEEDEYWGHVKIGWDGDGTGLKVTEKTETDKRAEALAKLSLEDKALLGLE